jgi:hypothetical protein
MFKDYMEMKHSNVQNLAPLAGLPQAAIIFASKKCAPAYSGRCALR